MIKLLDQLRELTTKVEVFTEEEIKHFHEIITREESKIKAAVTLLQGHGYIVQEPTPTVVQQQ